jgi:hypothetical protein
MKTTSEALRLAVASVRRHLGSHKDDGLFRGHFLRIHRIERKSAHGYAKACGDSPRNRGLIGSRFQSMMPAETRSTAICRAAQGVRLPDRVWRK